MQHALAPGENAMAPVIRITDEVFQRLQAYGVPLVDTPSSVIEKVLDRLEQKEKELPPSEERDVGRSPASGDQVGLYLAPAHSENLKATVISSVPIAQIRDVLPEGNREAVEKISGNGAGIRAWAMTRNSRALYSSMRPGDVVMFTERGTGKFGYAGRVGLKIESRNLGERLWRDVPNLPWELIYLLTDIREVNASKPRVLGELGYDPNFVVPGITRVSPEKIRNALSKHGLVEEVLATMVA
jgi:hypothetical protein